MFSSGKRDRFKNWCTYSLLKIPARRWHGVEGNMKWLALTLVRAYGCSKFVWGEAFINDRKKVSKLEYKREPSSKAVELGKGVGEEGKKRKPRHWSLCPEKSLCCFIFSPSSSPKVPCKWIHVENSQPGSYPTHNESTLELKNTIWLCFVERVIRSDFAAERGLEELTLIVGVSSQGPWQMRFGVTMELKDHILRRFLSFVKVPFTLCCCYLKTCFSEL